jgi:NADH-quinone oxidoreductase subunit I
MIMREQDVYVVESPKMDALAATYLPEVFKGLGTTFKHIAGTVGGGRRRKTVQYPEQRREDRPVEEGGLYRGYYRGVHRLNRDEQGRVKCVACFMCSTACPAQCIHIEAEESPWEDREKYPRKFDIDELRCIYCGMCEEACPVDAIELTPVYDAVGHSRQEMIYDKAKLLAMYDQTVDDKPM